MAYSIILSASLRPASLRPASLLPTLFCAKSVLFVFSFVTQRRICRSSAFYIFSYISQTLSAKAVCAFGIFIRSTDALLVVICVSRIFFQNTDVYCYALLCFQHFLSEHRHLLLCPSMFLSFSFKTQTQATIVFCAFDFSVKNTDFPHYYPLCFLPLHLKHRFPFKKYLCFMHFESKHRYLAKMSLNKILHYS